MTSLRRRLFTTGLIAAGALLALAVLLAGYVRAGVYGIGADDPHWPSTTALLAQLRDRSIDARAARLDVPAGLGTPAQLRQGAGNYAAMCVQCHLAPGLQGTELSRGLYPAPPDLTRTRVDTARAFWAIKHGIKASGMPAWGRSMADPYVWNLAAFVNRLPTLDADAYARLVAESGGHSHGGGETAAVAGATPAAHVDPPVAAPHAHPAPAHVDPPGAPAHHHDTQRTAPAPHVDPPADHHDAPGTPPHSH